LLVGLCACSTPGLEPPSQNPPVAVPAGWQEADAAGAGAAGLGPVSMAAWWRRFDDPGLSSLIDEALRANTRIETGRAALRQALALRAVAAAALWPSLGGTASAQTGTSGGHSTGNVFQLGLDGNWSPDAFGVIRAGVDAADATAQAAGASLGDVQVQVAAEVALDYILLRASQSRLAIARDNLASQSNTLQITQWRQQAGLATELESAQARAEVAQTQAQLPALQTAIVQTQHALRVLSGHPPAAPTEPADAASTPQPVPQAQAVLPATLPAETLRQRADVRAAEHQVAAALARVGQAQAQRWPSFAIGGSLGLSALTVGALGQGASVVSSLLARVTLPIFDGGALRAQAHAQQAALDQAQQAYRASILTALQQVEDAWVELGSDRLRLQALQQASESAAVAARLARQRYGSGLVDFQTVLVTQRTEYATQDGVVSAMANLGSDHVRLFKALGGGWREGQDAPQATASALGQTP
jgi:NodT family efflux transporter outer membrane factor (OMF) lipoprotein